MVELNTGLLDRGAIGLHGRFQGFGGRNRHVVFLLGDEFTPQQRLQASLLHLGVFELRFIPRERSERLVVLRLIGAGIDSNNSWPAFTVSPSWNDTESMTPETCARSVTLCSGSTVPAASITTGMDLRTTRVAWTCSTEPGPPRVVLGAAALLAACQYQYPPAADRANAPVMIMVERFMAYPPPERGDRRRRPHS